MRASDENGDAISWGFAYELPHTVYAWDGDPTRFDPSTRKALALGRDGYRSVWFAVCQPPQRALRVEAPSG